MNILQDLMLGKKANEVFADELHQEQMKEDAIKKSEEIEKEKRDFLEKVKEEEKQSEKLAEDEVKEEKVEESKSTKKKRKVKEDK